MFTFDLKVARQRCIDSENDVLIFLVHLDNGRNLPVYLSTSECLLSVMENIKEYIVALKEFFYDSDYSYGCLICVGYAE